MSRRTGVGPAWWGVPRRGRRGRRPRGRGPALPLGRRVAGWASVGVTAVLVIGVLAGYVKYRSIWDSIKRVDVSGLLGSEPRKLNNAENILVLGSDTRVGQNGVGGSAAGTPGGRSDTLMLLHISPGQAGATVLSIPRDSVVPVVGCGASDGTAGQQAAPGQLERINAALNNGGPACTWKTVAQLTGVHIDHFIQLDFTGFEKIIDDLGGVTVCLPAAVSDPRSGLSLPAGPHHVFGREALAFWREREAVGNGSDLQRIQRDQFLMASLVQGIEHSGLLNSPARVLRVLGDAADAMTTDTGLDQTTMLRIAESLRGLRPRSVQFVTAPNVAYPPDPNEVEFAQPMAGELFTAIAHDNKLPRAGRAGRPRRRPAGPAGTVTPVVDTTPSQVKVQVQNGAGTSGLAGQVDTDLTRRGFDVVGSGDAATFTYTTSVIEYAAPADLPAVSTLKALLATVTVVHDPSLTPGTITLIVGSAYTGLKTPSARHTAATAATPSVSRLSTGDGAITASTGACQDAGAFSGPNGG
jgi:LCP family protein required for cell wall assembly